jgi:hypothetical protein
MNWKRVLLPLSIFAAAIWMAGISPAPEAEPARDSRARRVIRRLVSPFRWLGRPRLEHWMLIVTAGLATATFWLAWDGHRQLDEMRVERRPWIEVDAYIGGVTWSEQGVHIVLRYEMKNTGHSPALHVLPRDEIVPFLSVDPKMAPIARLKQITAEQQKRQDNLGYPLLPGQTISSQGVLIFSKEQIDKYQSDMTRADFRSPTTHEAAPPASEDKFLALSIIYVVDYTSDTDADHHQTYCWLNIYYIDPRDPLGPGRALPIGKDLPASSLRLESMPEYCNAD